ncbi:MAG: thioredoxin family protein [Verrucomicrobia bacterium]|nr:thioredoxin family protein [Verrucomicrobiota bacterium]
MKAITHLALYTVAAVAMVGSAFAEPLKGWSEDLDKALETAKKEKKSVLVEFTGSDWCPPCKMMRKEVFSKEEFVKAASKNFILVEIDMPKGDQETAKKNEPTVKKYKVDGFPTVILLHPDGKEFARFYASEHPKTEDFLKRLDKELENKDLD